MHPYALIYIISLVTNVVAGGVGALFLIFSAYENVVARAFGRIPIALIIWSVAIFFGIFSPDAETALLAFQISMFGFFLVGLFFFDFGTRFIELCAPVSYTSQRRRAYVIASIFSLFLLADIFFRTGFILDNEIGQKLWFRYWPDRGTLFEVFLVSFILSFHMIYVYLFRIRNSVSLMIRRQIDFIFWTTLIPVIGGTTQFLMWYGIELVPLGGFSIPVYLFGLIYNITRFRLFNTKVITAELSTITIWMVLLARILISKDQPEFFVTLGILAITVFFGLITIRSVITEVKQKDHLELLTQELDHANRTLTDLNQNLEAKAANQTEEVRKAYEVEKKARIELQELDKSKDQFILTTQHHLRTPLTVVKGFIELSLDEKEINENVKTYLSKAGDAVDRMSGLISDLLSVSQVEIGKVRPQPVVLREVIEEIHSELMPAVENKNLSFAVFFSPESNDVQIAADRKIVKAALYNLIDNAVKYTPHGGIVIKGDIINVADSTIPFLKIDIIDTGIGIEEKDLPLIFNRFFERGAEAKKVNLSGKGIGLALSKRIIESHGGTVSVNSQGKGKGSTFTIKFPMIVPASSSKK